MKTKLSTSKVNSLHYRQPDIVKMILGVTMATIIEGNERLMQIIFTRYETYSSIKTKHGIERLSLE